MVREDLKRAILSKDSSLDFEYWAMQLFKYQYEHNVIYRSFVANLKINTEQVSGLKDIPYLPISAFKNNTVKSADFVDDVVFQSSGTTSSITSKHHVADVQFYKDHALKLFESSYGSIKEYCVLALLPSYLERKNSSLVSMVDYFIRHSEDTASGFYLNNIDALAHRLNANQSASKKTLLIGVSFALLDMARSYNRDWSSTIFMETGGMKGRTKEIPRSELHEILTTAFNVDNIHSEYGMTELLSQAYSKGDGVFVIPETMHISISETTDPLTEVQSRQSGLVRIIDLANIDSCAFIQTEDLGRKLSDDTFEILGRLDNSDIRGCSLLYI